jgi:protein ImuA
MFKPSSTLSYLRPPAPRIEPAMVSGSAFATVGAAASATRVPEEVLTSGFHELLATAPDHKTVTTAFVLNMAQKAAAGHSLCYCSLAGEAREHGQLYGHGLAGLGIAPNCLLMVTAPKEKELLWTLEEAAASGAFGAIIGALGTKERIYGFAASRRLKLRATSSGTPLFLIRHWSAESATAAHGRWRVSARSSRPQGERAGFELLGPARLQLQLERMGGFPPQHWEMAFDAARGFHMAPVMENGPDRDTGQGRHRAA